MLNDYCSLREDLGSKRGCFEPDVFSDPDHPGREPTVLPRIDPYRPDLDNGGHHEDLVDSPQVHQGPFSPSRLDLREAANSPVPRHRRLPVIPRPRFPAAILSPLSLAAMFSPPANLTVPLPFHNVTPPPFCFTPSVEYSTAVPVSGSTLPPPPPPPPFACCHPAFWGAMPYLIGRALLGVEQVRWPVAETEPGLCRSSWRSWEPRPDPRRCHAPASPLPDVGVRPLTETASSGLEDMARMVSRLDDVKKTYCITHGHTTSRP